MRWAIMKQNGIAGALTTRTQEKGAGSESGGLWQGGRVQGGWVRETVQVSAWTDLAFGGDMRGRIPVHFSPDFKPLLEAIAR